MKVKIIDGDIFLVSENHAESMNLDTARGVFFKGNFQFSCVENRHPVDGILEISLPLIKLEEPVYKKFIDFNGIKIFKGAIKSFVLTSNYSSIVLALKSGEEFIEEFCFPNKALQRFNELNSLLDKEKRMTMKQYQRDMIRAIEKIEFIKNNANSAVILGRGYIGIKIEPRENLNKIFMKD